MDGQTSSGVQSATTSFTFEVLSFLVGYQNLQVIEIALTVIAPGSGKELLDVWMTALLLSYHCIDGRQSEEEGPV